MINNFLILASIAQQATVPAIDIHDWAIENYGPKITFDIKRKGRNIGLHEVVFENINGCLHVEATTEIRVKFLFFNAFRFDYYSKEIWDDGKLISMKSFTDDNGMTSEVVLGKGAGIEANSTDDHIFTTNHWNPNVLSSKQVLNTITGKTNNIRISNVGWDMVPAKNGEIEAVHHTYHGDLRDISSWYDEKWRWVGLSFKGRDGSVISYECNQCGDQ